MRGASRLAVGMGISPLVVGLTVVALGTSAPELVVCLQASLKGQPDLAIGNVVGSNILNVLLILGLSALIVPLRVSQQLIRFDVPLMVGISLLVWWMSANGTISRLEGGLLSLGLASYVGWSIISSRRESAEIQAEYAAEFGKPATGWRAILWSSTQLVVGLGMLVLGSRWFVGGAVEIARGLGVSELVIGLTVVALGTSLPEVATSVMAAVRGERDIAVGNVVGSNLFNLLGVLGLTSLVSTSGIPVSEAAVNTDLPVMAAVAIACLPIFFTGNLIARWEGGLFLGYYVAYTLSLVLTATLSELSQSFNKVMLWFVIPLTVITLLTGLVRTLRSPPPTKE